MNAQLSLAPGIRDFGQATPDGTAVVHGDRSLTIAALDERSNRLAQAILGYGMAPGDPLAVLANNSLEFFEISAAMAKAGISTVPLNTRNNVQDNEYIHRPLRPRRLARRLARQGLLDVPAERAGGGPEGRGLRA